MKRFTHARWMAATVAAVTMVAAGVALAMPAPAAVTKGDATYVSGGVGRLQADAMHRIASRYPVSMTFAKHNQGRNEYVAGVDLRVTAANGKSVVDVHDGGPLLLLKLPDGKYTIHAEYDGHAKTQTLDVTAGHHEKVGFLWS